MKPRQSMRSLKKCHFFGLSLRLFWARQMKTCSRCKRVFIKSFGEHVDIVKVNKHTRKFQISKNKVHYLLKGSGSCTKPLMHTCWLVQSQGRNDSAISCSDSEISACQQPEIKSMAEKYLACLKQSRVLFIAEEGSYLS